MANKNLTSGQSDESDWHEPYLQHIIEPEQVLSVSEQCEWPTAWAAASQELVPLVPSSFILQGPHTPTAGVVSLALAVFPQNGSLSTGEFPVVHDAPKHYKKTFTNVLKLGNVFHIMK